jgi:hypothetical protein
MSWRQACDNARSRPFSELQEASYGSTFFAVCCCNTMHEYVILQCWGTPMNLFDYQFKLNQHHRFLIRRRFRSLRLQLRPCTAVCGGGGGLTRGKRTACGHCLADSAG